MHYLYVMQPINDDDDDDDDDRRICIVQNKKSPDACID